MKNSIIKVFILMLIVLGVVGCDPTIDGEILPELHLTASNYILDIGDEQLIEYSVLKIKEYELEFLSSDKEIFQVIDGKIVAYKSGEGTLRVSLKGYEDIYQEVSVLVKEKIEEITPEIKLTESVFRLDVGEEVLVDFSVVELEEYEVEFSSSNMDVFQIIDGKIIAKAAGNGTLRVSLKGQEDIYSEALVIVSEVKEIFPELYLPINSYTLDVGEEREIRYDVYDIDEYELVFTSSAENVFTIVDGYIFALGSGEAVLGVSLKGYPDIYREATIVVRGNPDEYAEEMAIIIQDTKDAIGIDLVEAQFFPTIHSNYRDAKITYRSTNPGIVTNEGLLSPNQEDEEVLIYIIIDYNDATKIESHLVNVVGTRYRNAIRDFFGQFPAVLTTSLNLDFFESNYPDLELSFRSSDPEVMTSDGKYEKPNDDEDISLYITVKSKTSDYEKEFKKDITARGYSIHEKAEYVKDLIFETIDLDGNVLKKPLVLIKEDPKFGGTITWSSNFPKLFGTDGIEELPLMNTFAVLQGSYTLGEYTSSFILEFEVQGREQSNDMWANIEEFLNKYIFLDEIETLKYSVMGVASPYLAYNEGYIPFYQHGNLEVIEDYLPVGHKNDDGNSLRPGNPMTVKYVTIHDTAGNGVGQDAAMHSKYIHSTKRVQSSWHYTIDDYELYHHIPNNEVAWHAGDGGSGPGNSSSIGIETCTHVGVDYDLVMRRTAKLTAQLLDEYGLGISQVKMHRDWTGKNCPQVIIASNRWAELLNLIAIELYSRQNLSDVQFEWQSLSPDILDNTGKVINHPGNETEVSYQVNVTYANETRTYTHTALLQASKK